jgi:hypothetical protein
VLESALFEDAEKAADEPATGTKVPSDCKTNLAGPVASEACEGAETAGWAQLGEYVKTKSVQTLASQVRAQNASVEVAGLRSPRHLSDFTA